MHDRQFQYPGSKGEGYGQGGPYPVRPLPIYPMKPVQAFGQPPVQPPFSPYLYQGMPPQFFQPQAPYPYQQPSQASTGPSLLNQFQDESGQIDIQKTLATVGQLANTVQQITPVIKQVGSMIRYFR